MVTSFLVRGSHREVSNMNTAQNKNGYFILISGTIAAFNIVCFFFKFIFGLHFLSGKPVGLMKCFSFLFYIIPYPMHILCSESVAYQL